MAEALPVFRYHPNPLRSGAIQVSEALCKSCERSRGYIYVGPVYSEQDGLDGALCPWCIADGSAASRFHASFADVQAIVDEVPESVCREVAERTPGYTAWQSTEWRACCGDAAAFLRQVAEHDLLSAELPRSRSALLKHLIANEGMDSVDAGEFVKTLTVESGHSVYLFRCLKCGQYQFHIDCE